MLDLVRYRLKDECATLLNLNNVISPTFCFERSDENQHFFLLDEQVTVVHPPIQQVAILLLLTIIFHLSRIT